MCVHICVCDAHMRAHVPMVLCVRELSTSGGGNRTSKDMVENKIRDKFAE